MNRRHLFVLGILLLLLAGGFLLYSYLFNQDDDSYLNTDVHVHSDFLLYINDQQIDLTADRYQSLPGAVKHKNIHLHDNEDHVVHRHADGIPLAEFLDSIGITLTDDCLTIDDGTEYCASDDTELALYVNGQRWPELTEYENQEEDQLLLYYGTKANERLIEYMRQITDESCIYSGTCPERGIAPSESCGLTCEL